MGLKTGSKTVLGSTHVAEQRLFSIVPPILTFDAGFNLGSFLTFRGPNGLFCGYGKGSKTVLGSTHAVLLFSIVPSILTFNFDLILGSHFTFGALM